MGSSSRSAGEKLRDLGWALCGVGALLRRLGGYQWKWLWRYAGPGIVGLTAWAYGIRWWRVVLTAILMAAVATLGFEGAWAKDWRVILLILQGVAAGVALWPLAKPSWRWGATAGICGLAWPGLLALSNNPPHIPHGLVESAWGFIWYGCAAWLIVETGQKTKGS